MDAVRSPLPAWVLPLGLLVAWAGLKANAVHAWVLQVNALGDTDYYFWAVQRAVADGSVALWLTEYPTPAAWLLQVPYLLGADTQMAYRWGFMVMMTLVDFVFCVFLYRRLGAVPVLAWLVITSLAGQLALLRFDLVPAVLAGAALLLVLEGRTTAASPVLALGTAAKVWPVLLFPLALGRPRHRLTATAAFLGTGVALAAVSVTGAGLPRLFSPLAYQGARGLQIEAVAATLPMLAWRTNPAYGVYYSPYKAYEIAGPTVAFWLDVLQVAGIVAALLGAACVAGWFVRGCPRRTTGVLALLLITLFIVTSKALSPQYILWLGALGVVVLGAADADADAFESVRVWVVTAWVAVLMTLTTGVYPTHYGAVTFRREQTEWAVTLLATRNVLLVGLTLFLLALVAHDVVRTRPARETVDAG